MSHSPNGWKMKKLMLLLSIFYCEIALSTTPTTALDCQSDFITTTELFEKKKAELIARIKKNNTQIETIQSTARSAAGPNNFFALFRLLIIIAEMPKEAALIKEQVKNQSDLTEINTYLETTYFNQLDPSAKKKLLLLKIEDHKKEAETLSQQLPSLSKTASTQSFYTKLIFLNTTGLLSSLAIMTRHSQLKYLTSLGLGLFIPTLCGALFACCKYESAKNAYEIISKNHKKLAVLALKQTELYKEIESLNTAPTPLLSSEQQTQKIRNLGVVPSNELFRKVYDEAHFEQLDTPEKKKKLLSKIETTITESNKLTNEALSLEKTAAKKTLYGGYLGASFIYFMSVSYLTSKVKTTPFSFSDNALGAYILFSSIPMFISLFKIIDAVEAGKTLKEVKGKLAKLNEKAAEHSANLAQIAVN